MAVKYTVGSLAGLSGLSAHTIRAWERRYQALTPDRSSTNRRLYDDADLERLTLLKKIVCRGHSIGQVAGLPTEQLRAFAEAHCTEVAAPATPRGLGMSSCELLAVSLDAVARMDAATLEETFARGTAQFGITGLLSDVIVPLVGEIEGRYAEGKFSISQEHLASAVLRSFLDRFRTTIPVSPTAPRMIVTTPQHQYHELGALMVAVVAAMQGWAVTYLGPNLPAREIAAAANRLGAAAVALSIVYPADDPSLAHELAEVRHSVGDEVEILVGGRAAFAYADALKAVGADVKPDLWSFGCQCVRIED